MVRERQALIPTIRPTGFHDATRRMNGHRAGLERGATSTTKRRRGQRRAGGVRRQPTRTLVSGHECRASGAACERGSGRLGCGTWLELEARGRLKRDGGSRRQQGREARRTSAGVSSASRGPEVPADPGRLELPGQGCLPVRHRAPTDLQALGRHTASMSVLSKSSPLNSNGSPRTLATA